MSSSSKADLEKGIIKKIRVTFAFQEDVPRRPMRITQQEGGGEHVNFFITKFNYYYYLFLGMPIQAYTR